MVRKGVFGWLMSLTQTHKDGRAKKDILSFPRILFEGLKRENARGTK